MPSARTFAIGAGRLAAPTTVARLPRRPAAISTSTPSPVADGQPSIRAAQRVNRAAGMLALSVLLDSAIEHYRGSFKNPAMYTPLVLSTLSLAVSAHGTADRRPGAHRARASVYSAAAITGIVGTGFHLYNILKRPGRFSWQNFFYGAPAGAPIAILLSGALGAAAEQVRNCGPGQEPRIFGVPAGRILAAAAGLGILGTSGEAGLLHFRGAYHNPAMFLPVTLPPIGAALLLGNSIASVGRILRPAQHALRLTALLGLVGAGFHIWGVQRNMGGWRNWRQNLLSGPPIPAPPSFTGLALAGLAALGLLENRPDA
jgi:hypothetical protein